MTVTTKVIREAALVNWLDMIADVGLQERIRNELWCLRNDIDTADLHDITTAGYTTSEIIRWVLDSGFRSRHDSAAFLLCTIQELS
jgi:hypothetical protein